jgi:vacuolar protein sorting-associated protein 72
MRELLEQERERLQAEADEPVVNPGKSVNEEDDEDAIFKDDAGADGEDVDFEQREDVEDVVDSDFDLSSDQGDEDDEEAGERELEEQEKAARKASRVAAQQKTKVAFVRKAPATSATAVKRTPSNVNAAAAAQQQRASKRAATMQVADAVQARLQQDMQKRAEMTRVATPKRKKVRLSQADLIAEALEMEDLNRESLKAFFEREEQRRERDRRKSKKRMEGPFLRWRSVAVNRVSGQQRHAIEVLDERTGMTKPQQSLTLDPVFAAREAAVQERKRLTAASSIAGADSKAEQLKDDMHSRTSTSTSDLITAPQNAAPEETPQEDVTMQETSTLTVVTDGEEQKAETPEARATGASTETDPMKEEWESRAYVSIHDLPASTPWPVLFGHVLGTHVDWSRYAIVPARNRPLRPRQSVCPITGLPAVYPDPRTGIAFANLEAYVNITKLLDGAYRWSGLGIEMSSDTETTSKARKSLNKDVAQAASTDPLHLGCFLDHIDEPGANQVLALAYPSSASSVDLNGKPAPHGTTFQYVPRGALAPGDEQAVVAAAKALPAGTTRSGTRRSAV